MANIAIFRINYKSDFVLTLHSDAGWLTPFCIKFWTGAPSQAYFAGYDGTTYTHCAPVDGEPTKLKVQFDDHHLPIGELKFQIAYHFTVADFPTSVEDEVLNQASVIIEVDDAPAQVMLDLNGETAPEIEFSLPAYANEAQRIANEEQRIAAEAIRIGNEESRIAAETIRQQNEAQRISNEESRVAEFAQLKQESKTATVDANAAAALANEKAALASDKAALADAAATLANAKAQLAADKAALADAAATLANDKAALAQQKAEYAQTQGNYAKSQGDYAKKQGEIAEEDHGRAEADHTTAADDHQTAASDHTRAEQDHATAASDHTRAEEDHSTASADHTTATNDHTQAVNDHATATSDHTQAGNDHDRAESDHSQAAQDHERAESDHAAVEVYVDSLGAFDISSYHAIGGVLAKYADLAAALDPNNGGGVPQSLQKGGMSVKFVQSSDNKYVQYFLTKDEWSASEGDWEKMNLEEEVSQLVQEVDDLEDNVTDIRGFYKINGNGYITSGGIWNGTGKHLAIKLDGTQNVKIIPASEKDTHYAFLVSYSTASAPVFAGGATGYSTIAAGGSGTTVTVPNDAGYLYIATIEGANTRPPKNVLFDGISLFDTLFNLGTDLGISIIGNALLQGTEQKGIICKNRFFPNTNSEIVNCLLELYLTGTDSSKTYQVKQLYNRGNGKFKLYINTTDSIPAVCVVETGTIGEVTELVPNNGSTVSGYCLVTFANTTEIEFRGINLDYTSITKIDYSPSIKDYLTRQIVDADHPKIGINYVEMRQGSTVNLANAYAVTSKYKIPVTPGQKIYFGTSKPVSSGYKYGFFFATYANSTGKNNGTSTIRRVDYDNISGGDNNFVVINSGEGGIGFGISEYVGSTPKTLNISEFTNYKVFFSFGNDGSLQAEINEINDGCRSLENAIESIGGEQQIGLFPADQSVSIVEQTPLAFKTGRKAIEYKYSGAIVPGKRFLAVGFDDFRATDFSWVLPLMNKYGVKVTFNKINYFTPSSPTAAEIQQIKAVLNSGHEVGDHTINHQMYWVYSPLFNGQNPASPDGEQVPFPSNAQMREDAGNGKNVFGLSLSAMVKDTLAYNGPISDDTTWGDLTDAQCQTIRESYSLMKCPLTNPNGNTLIEAYDFLSNLFLGTTGSSNGSWDGTQYTGGLFTGCKSSANHEVWERICTIQQMYNKLMFNENFDFKTWSCPGDRLATLYFPLGDSLYFDEGHTSFATNTGRLTSSHIKNPDGTYKSRSWMDVLGEFGYVATHDDRCLTTYECIKHTMNARGVRPSDLLCRSEKLIVYSNGKHNYTLSQMSGGDSYEQVMYDDSVNTDFHDAVEKLRHNTAMGFVAGSTWDSTNTVGEKLYWEGILRFCKSVGIEIVPRATAYDIEFNHPMKDGNLLVNPYFNNSALVFMPTAESVPTNPDGYIGDCHTVTGTDGVNTLVTDGSVVFRHYSLPIGNLVYKVMAKGSGSLSFYYIRNNTALNGHSELIGTINVTEADFTEKSITIPVPDEAITAYDKFCGYGNKIIGIYVEISSGLTLKTPSLTAE